MTSWATKVPKWRTKLLALGTLGITAAVLFYLMRPPSAEEKQFRLRYAELVSRLHSDASSQIASVLSPEVQPSDKGIQNRLITFARPLTSKSEVSIKGDMASVTPEPQRHYLIIPGGHTVHLQKTRGEWYFTGKVNVD